MTPIVYELSSLTNPTLRRVLFFSPMTPYVSAYQDIFYFRQWPSAAIWATTMGYAVVALAVGLWLIVRNEDSFAERV